MQIAIWILSVLTGLYGIHFMLIAVFGAFRKHRHFPRRAPRSRIAVVVPARNERAVVGQLVKSLMEQNYPKELYDVVVVPNNCTDDTAEVAAEAGAVVLPCTVPVKSKGEVMRFAIAELLPRGYDGFVVFDADNLADPNFLRTVNDALISGEQIAQGYRDSKNADSGWIAGGVSIFYWGMNRLYNHARNALGLSAALNGTGFMVSAELMRKIGWNTRTLTEDLELTALCALNGVKVGWMQDAVTYDEQPVRFRDSYVQRRRWSAGTVQCMRLYLKGLLRAMHGRHWFQCYDMAVLFTGTVMQLICLIPVALGALEVGMMVVRAPSLWPTVVRYLGLGLLNGTLVPIAIALLICVSERRMNAKRISAVILFPLFLMTWIPANLVSLFTKPPKWTPIAHTCAVDGVPPRPERPVRADTKEEGV